jgi:hypothetical protein
MNYESKKMKNFRPFVTLFILLFVVTSLLTGCKGYDPKLMTPDCCGKGYNLTPLGSLVYGPWQTKFDGYNVSVDSCGKEIASVGYLFSDQQKDLVFELRQDGSVNYWFKRDYDSLQASVEKANTNGIKVEKKYSPKEGSIKHIYKGKKWEANFMDSSLVIDFGKNDFGLPSLKGKYAQLGSGTLYFKQAYTFDSIYNGRTITLKKVISTRFEHPYIKDLSK